MLLPSMKLHINDAVVLAESLYKAYCNRETFEFLVEYYNRPKISVFGTPCQPSPFQLWAAIIIYKAYTYKEIKPIDHYKWDQIVSDVFDSLGDKKFKAIDDVLNYSVPYYNSPNFYPMVAQLIDSTNRNIVFKNPDEIRSINYDQDKKVVRYRASTKKYIEDNMVINSVYQDYIYANLKQYKITIQEVSK